MVRAVDDIPLATRLRVAQNIIFDRGGADGCADQDPRLVAAAKILREAVQVLEGCHPKAAKIDENGR
jgi:hypothetical protein